MGDSASELVSTLEICVHTKSSSTLNNVIFMNYGFPILSVQIKTWKILPYTYSLVCLSGVIIRAVLSTSSVIIVKCCTLGVLCSY